MANNKVKAISNIPIPDVKFNLEAQEQFANDKGIVFEHWAALPSSIGMKDRGDYRRSDSLDTIAEGGFIYKKMGEFVGTIINNSKDHQYTGTEAGIYDNTMGRLVLPRKYRKACTNNKDISLLPGDRIRPKDIELKVDNYQRVDHNPRGADILQFPAVNVAFVRDADNRDLKEGVDFKIDSDGNIKWKRGKRSPGVDPDTGKGRTYSIRYTYLAFWYIQQLINEIRITNEGDAEQPARLPYHATIQREYVFHNKTRGDAKDTNIQTHTERTTEEPRESISPDTPEVKVDIRNFSE